MRQGRKTNPEARGTIVDALAFEYKVTEFDFNALPAVPDLQRGTESALESIVCERLRAVFSPLPGEVRVTIHGEDVSVLWTPESSRDMDTLLSLGMGLMRGRHFALAEPVLRALLERVPDERRALFGLGTLLCEQGRAGEAREALERLTRTTPDFAPGWNALGVAFSGEGKRKAAAEAFRESLRLDPRDGHTLRNLGTLIGKKDPKEALPYLKGATKLLPSDQATRYVYGKCLMESGNPDEADTVLKKAVGLDAHSRIADLCREVRLKIARDRIKPAVPTGLRPDVVVYCLAALDALRGMGREGIEAAAYEIASVAGRGLNLRDRKSRYRLQSLPGAFSALQLISCLYVALKKSDPRADAGIDFTKEYELALRMCREKRSTPSKRGKRK